jgi:ribosomal protein L14
MQKNAIVLLNKKKQLLGTSVNGPVSRQLRSKKYMKILLLSGMLFI